MADVCFVLMPYADVTHPSLAIGILKGCLNNVGITSQAIYGNLRFAEQIGLKKYRYIDMHSSEDLVGEWTFAHSAFPDHQPDYNNYFQTTALKLNPSKIELLFAVRRQAKILIDRLAQEIVAINPKIVSCSSTFQQHCSSLALLRKIKEINPHIITLIGGANCEGIMGITTHRAFPWVDFVASGEGDETFAPLCQLLIQEGVTVDCQKLPHGIIGPGDRHNHPRWTEPPRAIVHNLENIPTPDYDDYFRELEQSSLRKVIKPGLLAETSRGCWWGQKNHCTFCGLNGDGIGYRTKSTERVLSEFADLAQRYDMQGFEVVDNILSHQHLDNLIPQFSEMEQRYTLFYETKANLNREDVEKLVAAGVNWIQPGIENLQDNVLKLMNKGTSTAINVQLLKWAREYGLRIAWNILVDFPGEKDEWYLAMAEWMPLIFHLQPPNQVRRIRIDRFSPYHNKPEKYNITISPFESYRYVYPLPPEQLRDLAYFFERTDTQGNNLHLNPIVFDGPGLKAVQKAYLRWEKGFWSGPTPLLCMDDFGDRLRIIDTRPCALSRTLELKAVDRLVYLACDRALTLREVGKELHQRFNHSASLEVIESSLNFLKAKKILLHASQRYLSLAVQGSIPPLPTKYQFAGGHIREDLLISGADIV